MIVVKLQGGLGNQMFQYAFGMALAHRYSTSLKFDLRFLLDRTPRKRAVQRNYDLDVFSIMATQATVEDLRFVGLGLENIRLQSLWLRLISLVPGQSRVLVQKGFAFDPRDLDVGGQVYVDGYWQSEKYFKDIESVLRQRLIVTAPPSTEAGELLHRIEAEESVCLNVRRTDFVNHPLHRALDVEYFSCALAELRKRVKKPISVYVFSDDIEWCRENLQLEIALKFISHEFAGAKFSTYLMLMSACRHFIIPNSSFAWWAAWLANNPDKVVVGPIHWFADPNVDTGDVMPGNWIRV